MQLEYRLEKRIQFLIRTVLVYTASTYKVSNQFIHDGKCAQLLKAYSFAKKSKARNIEEVRLAAQHLFDEQNMYFDILKHKINLYPNVALWHTKWGPWNIGKRAWEHVMRCAENDVKVMYTSIVFDALKISVENLANDRFVLKQGVRDKAIFERIGLGESRLVLEMSDTWILFMDTFLKYVHDFYSVTPSDRVPGTMSRIIYTPLAFDLRKINFTYRRRHLYSSG